MNDDSAWDVLACPACKGRLAASDAGDGAACEKCGARFGRDDGVLDLVPADVRARIADAGDPAWERWREAIRGLEAWRARRKLRARGGALPADGADDAAIARLLARAGVARGAVVVDVGAKDGARAALLPEGARYVGVDPFATHGARGVLTVRGVAEALPVRDRAADVVTSFAAFDYFVDPHAAVAEIHRVLRPKGALAVVVSVVPSVVASARGASTRWARIQNALLAAREVGVAAGAGLVGAAVLERDRPHTQYFTRAALLATLRVKFDVEHVDEAPQPASSVLYVVARKRQDVRLKVL